MTCARPISAPSALTIELLLMFWALNGATETPSRTSHRQMPAVTTHLPASEVVPAINTAPLTRTSLVAPAARPSGRTPPRDGPPADPPTAILRRSPGRAPPRGSGPSP